MMSLRGVAISPSQTKSVAPKRHAFSSESLWLAGIDPRRSAGSLTIDELARLHDAIGKVLSEGIALRGTQRDLFGRKGQAVHRRYIFEKSREPCPRCSTPIAYIRIGGRNTFYCPNCQH